MLSFKSLITASALLTILSGVNAGVVVHRNQEDAQPSCTDFTPFTYAGCFVDPSSPRGLLYSSNLDTQNMTVEKCVAFCKGNDYRYAGLEYYGECFCGASVNGPSADESQCSYPCTGNSSEACGGFDIISVYQDPTFPTVDGASILDYNPLGCYSETTTGRTLAWRQDQVDATTLTIETCLHACKAGGYDLAGVEYGHECYCGVVMGNGTQPLPASSCNMPCTGDATETCGGSGTIQLYAASDLESSQPCYAGSSSSSSSTVTSTTSSSSSIYSTSSATTTSTTSTSTTSSTSSYSTPTTSGATSTTSSTSSNTLSTSVTSSTTSTSSSSTSTISATTSTSSSSSSTLTTSVTSTTSPTSSRTSSSSPVPTTITTSTRTTASLCTTTITTSPTATCEYSCGSWCSSPMPDFSDSNGCSKAAQWISVQVASCFLQAGWPASLQCFDFAKWTSSVKTYCSNSCPGNQCSRSGCRSKNPPSGPALPSPTTTTSVYTCSASSISSTTTTTTTSVPVPTNTNICSQPSNSRYGYSGSSPVGNIAMPCLTCNNLASDYQAGNIFKLYTSSESKSCPSYKKSKCANACQNACDSQYSACKQTYAQSCKSNSWWSIITGQSDSYDGATNKCTQQWNDCYSVNQGVSGGSRCGSWNAGWS